MNTIKVPSYVIRDLPKEALGELIARRIETLSGVDIDSLGEWFSTLHADSIESFFRIGEHEPVTSKPTKTASKPTKKPKAGTGILCKGCGSSKHDLAACPYKMTPEDETTSTSKEAALEAIKRRGADGISAKDFAFALGLRAGQAKGMLRRMQLAQEIETKGAGKGTKYHAKEKAA